MFVLLIVPIVDLPRVLQFAHFFLFLFQTLSALELIAPLELQAEFVELLVLGLLAYFPPVSELMFEESPVLEFMAVHTLALVLQVE